MASGDGGYGVSCLSGNSSVLSNTDSGVLQGMVEDAQQPQVFQGHFHVRGCGL